MLRHNQNLTAYIKVQGMVENLQFSVELSIALPRDKIKVPLLNRGVFWRQKENDG